MAKVYLTVFGRGLGCRRYGTARPQGRDQGHGPRPLRPGGGAGCPEGGRPPLAHQPGVCRPPSTPRERPRGGRGGADRGQAQGEDERGAGQTTGPLSGRASTIAHIYPSVLQTLAGRGYAGCLERVILGVSGRGYAGSWIRTSENSYSTNSGE